MSGRLLRVGLVGAGRWAGVHRDALRSVAAEGDAVQLAAVAVSSEASAERVREAWAVAAFADVDAMLDQDLDAVIVASPNYLHADHGVAALEAGCHVLVEKPMAITLEGCDALLDAAERNGRVLAVGQEMRVFTLFERIREIIDEGAIGAPLHLDLRLFRRPYRGGSGGWKSDPAKLGSSVLEEPIHYLDLARWYFEGHHGEPARLRARAVSRRGRAALHENLDVQLAWPGGALASVTRSIAGWGHRVALDLVGEDGAVRARWEGDLDTDPEPRVSLALHRGDLRDAALAERIDVPGGRDGRAAVALSLAVDASLARNGEVDLAKRA